MIFALSLLICPFTYLSTVDDCEPDQLQIIGGTVQSLQKTHMTMPCTDGNTCIIIIYSYLQLNNNCIII